MCFYSDEENWRGKNNPNKSALKPRRAMQSMLNPSVQVSESIMLLRNGHLSSHGKQSIRTFNTCPFDSVFATIAAIYADHENIKLRINRLAPEFNFLSMIQEMFNGTGKIGIKHNALLRQRNLLLLSIFGGEEYECGLSTVDSQANVNYLIPKMNWYPIAAL